VVLAGRRRDALAALAGSLGERVRVEVAELAEPQAADQLIAAADADGGLDVLINNAGLTRDNLALRLKDEDWQTVLDVNLSAGFRLIRAALRGMMRRRWGRIVNVTSVVALTGNPGQANYAAAKAGMIGMTKSLAAEVASRGITLNCVAPGFIQTAMTDALSEDQRARLLERVPVGRLGSGADVAAAVGYLASDEAAYVTGQTLHVNGGMAMI
jgi:3-oxoacyl-[acyl-carrier protein] reductase